MTLHPSGLDLKTRYRMLPQAYWTDVCSPSFPQSALSLFNDPLAEQLGLRSTFFRTPQGCALLSGQKPHLQSPPLAMAYAGHQFGHYARLGDGRALLWAEHGDPRGKLWELHLKGAGPTPFARGGDGYAPLQPMLREFLISEALHALGIPTTRALSVCTTGMMIQRRQPVPGAVLMRVASSHLRVGTFVYAATENKATLQALLSYACTWLGIQASQPQEQALALWDDVAEKNIRLCVHWMRVGFIHGVLNTDNVSLSGETLDLGPCAFMNAFHWDTVYSAIDTQGRYAYGQQLAITAWNLTRFLESLLPCLHPCPQKALALCQERIDHLHHRLHHAWAVMMRQKLGFLAHQEKADALVMSLLQHMEARAMDYTQTFAKLSHQKSLDSHDPALQDWQRAWQATLVQENRSLEDACKKMQALNPYLIPRNAIVEKALVAAEQGDDSLFHRLWHVLQKPYDVPKESYGLAAPCPPEEDSIATFCGT